MEVLDNLHYERTLEARVPKTSFLPLQSQSLLGTEGEGPRATADTRRPAVSYGAHHDATSAAEQPRMQAQPRALLADCSNTVDNC